jgi:prepilin-type N-terminal cleavage/methylation domain-containing protein
LGFSVDKKVNFYFFVYTGRFIIENGKYFYRNTILMARGSTMMEKVIRCRRKNESGFTLVELLVVVAIIGALTAIVIPRVANRTPDARAKVNAATILQIESSSELYYLDHGTYSGTAKELETAGYLKHEPKIIYKDSGLPKYDGDEIEIDGVSGRVTTANLENE